MQDPLPPAPAGGYYIIEITGGFENNTIAGNTLDLTGKSSTGIVLDGEDYGTTIVGNHFIGGTIYDDGYNGTAISLGAVIGSAGSQGGAFPLPEGLDRAAEPGRGRSRTIRSRTRSAASRSGWNTIVNYWTSQVDEHQPDRSGLRVGDGHRQHVRVRFRLPPGLGHPVRRPGQ